MSNKTVFYSIADGIIFFRNTDRPHKDEDNKKVDKKFVHKPVHILINTGAEGKINKVATKRRSSFAVRSAHER